MEQFTNITTQQLYREFQENSQLLIVDLRDTDKYAHEHIQGSVSFPIKPTFWEKLFKKHSLKQLLGHDLDRAIAFY